MWSPSDLKASWTRHVIRDRPAMFEGGRSAAIDLHFDELVAMRGRGASFGQNQKIDGFRFGDLSSRRRGTGLELDNIGPYQWGDDIRHMDWFATARTGRPQVKQFRHDVQQTIILVIDLRPSMLFGSRRQLMAKTACLAAAKIAWTTSKDHQPLGLVLVDGKGAEAIPARRGRRARLQHLARIADAYRRAIDQIGDANPPLADRLEGLPASMSGDVEAVFISDFSRLGPSFDQRMRETGARGALSAIVIEDELMLTPPPAGSYPLRGRPDQRLAMIAIRNGEAALYTMQAEQERRSLTARLLSLGMRQVLISDAQSINEGYFR